MIQVGSGQLYSLALLEKEVDKEFARMQREPRPAYLTIDDIQMRAGCTMLPMRARSYDETPEF